MKLEIMSELRCGECGGKVKEKAQYVRNSIVIIQVQPCPNCRPAKPEKVAPKKGEVVEVRCNSYSTIAFDTRNATGKRDQGTRIEVYSGDGQLDFAYNQWRYPGETDDEWKD